MKPDWPRTPPAYAGQRAGRTTRSSGARDGRTLHGQALDRRQPGRDGADRPEHAEPVAGVVVAPQIAPRAATVFPSETTSVATFSIEDGGVLQHSAVPTLRFGLRVESDEEVRSLALNVQVRIAATQRTYSDAEEEALRELFGAPSSGAAVFRACIGRTWRSSSRVQRQHARRSLVDVHVRPRGHGGEVPHRAGATARCRSSSSSQGPSSTGNRSRCAPSPGMREAGYRLPVSVWREMMDRFFPSSAWLRLDSDLRPPPCLQGPERTPELGRHVRGAA